MKTTSILKKRHFIVMAMCLFTFTANANILFTNTPSSLTIKNGGILYLKDDCDLDVPVGCTVDFSSGTIEKRPRIL